MPLGESHTRFFSSGAPRSSLFPPLTNFSTIFISAVLAQGPGKGPGEPESLNSLLLATSYAVPGPKSEAWEK